MTEKELSAKDALLFVPIIGTAAAFFYEIGSFAPIGGHAFEQFSLAEHIVFALPALAFAIAFALGALSGAIYHLTKPGKDELRQKLRTEPGMTIAEMIFLAIVIIPAIIAAYYEFYSIGFVVISIIALLVLVSFRPPPSNPRPLQKLIVVFFAIWLASLTLFIGGDMTRRDMNSRDPLNMIEYNRQVIAVRVLRAGDRGLLVYDPATRKLHFLARDSIKGNEWVRPDRWSF